MILRLFLLCSMFVPCCLANFGVSPVELPVTFERNEGQWSREVQFGAHIQGHFYAFSSKEISIDGSIHLMLVSSTKARFEPLDRVESKTNYLNGRDTRKWVTGVLN